MKTAATVIRFTLLTGVLFAANPRAGVTPGGVWVASCTAQSVAAVGVNGFKAHSLLGNPFAGIAMNAFGCY